MQKYKLRFTEEEVAKWATFYKKGHSIKETALNFKVGYRDILHYLIYFKYYIPKKKYTNVRNFCVNEDFFETIDSEHKAYFLGLLMSDGYITTTSYSKTVGLALKESDKYILDKLNNYISPNKKVTKYKNSYKWMVTSPKMYYDLSKYGICEGKSHCELRYPIIPPEYDKDFIRGYFDGDGCISLKSTGFSVISFCSNSKVFLTSLAKVLLHYGIKTRPIYTTSAHRKSEFHTLYISGGNNKKVFKKFLYKDATIFLNRKYDKFMRIPC